MARIDNLTNFLTDVASAIKTKSGDSTNIPAANFDNEILNLPSQGNYQIKTVNITNNGEATFGPDSGYDAISNIIINTQVPMPQLQSKSYEFTSNQNITLLPDTGFDGFTDISVSINVPTEDLDSTVTALENQVTALTAALENKSSGGEAEPLIYVQTSEPATKDGIWLQTNGTAEHYKSDDSIYFSGTWSNDGDTASTPYSFYNGSAVAIGTDIYLFGSASNGTMAYKYDTLTNTYTQLTNVPYSFFQGGATNVGTDIYLFGGDSSSSSAATAYKYDTLTDTYTRIAGVPVGFKGGSVASIGTDIYLFGTSNTKQAYKYDTLTNTYTKLANIPYYFFDGAIVAAGTDIYLVGSYIYSEVDKNMYKYNTLTDTYTQLTSIPYDFTMGSAVIIGTDIYLLGCGMSKYTRNMYKYNILTDTYTQLTNIPYDFYHGSAVAINTNIYILGGEASSTKTRVYHIQTKTYDTDNTVIIAQGRKGTGATYNTSYAVKLLNTTFDEGFEPLYGVADAWFYTTQNGVDTTIPTYYGDGTQWIKFKN